MVLKQLKNRLYNSIVNGENYYDVIFTDVKMSEISGDQVLQYVKL